LPRDTKAAGQPAKARQAIMTSFGATDRIVEIAASASQMNPPDASPRKPSAQGMTLTPARHHANAAGGIRTALVGARS